MSADERVNVGSSNITFERCFFINITVIRGNGSHVEREGNKCRLCVQQYPNPPKIQMVNVCCLPADKTVFSARVQTGFSPVKIARKQKLGSQL